MEPLRFTEAEKAAFRIEYAPKSTHSQFELFISHCEHNHLQPGRHVIFHVQRNQVYSPELGTYVTEEKVVFITTVEAMLLLADRTGEYAGQRPIIWHYPDGTNAGFIESKIPLGRPCHAASVEILRKGLAEPIFGVARYAACVQLNEKKEPNWMWARSGEEMTGKCAVANGLRKAFPGALGKLYIAEELGTVTEQQPVTVDLTVKAPGNVVAIVTPASLPVNQEPAKEKEARPDAMDAFLHLGGDCANKPFIVGNGAAVGAFVPRDPMVAIDKMTAEINQADEPKPKPVAPPKPVVAESPSIFDEPELSFIPGAGVGQLGAIPIFADISAAGLNGGDPTIQGIVGIPVSDLAPDDKGLATCTQKFDNAANLPLEPSVPVDPAPAPAPVAPSTTEASAKKTESAPSTTPITSADPAASTGQTADRLPTVAEYRAFMARCTHLVRDVLQKAGKPGEAASKEFLPYLQKITGKPKTNEMSFAELERILTNLESLPPAGVIAAVNKGLK